ncbi:hypothetical protein Tsubulata_012980 [Turnera subulata]|uniref:Protein DEFECTIVE IN MERISTEM SILENCING 3 n=1 Tax=Turnera subulata TaxID=218843 RepID=A0A9Q0FAC8_9ROSI|nr:hypothetical protein Tsubulata_012980 [Turnera subulata]
MSAMFQTNHKGNIERLRKDIARHGDNLILLKTEADRLDKSILDLQASLVKDRSSSVPSNTDGKSASHSEEETRKQILEQRNSAAGILCWMKTHHAILASNLPLINDVLGVVATLASVDNDNISRLLSEYLGLEAMLGIVCKTFLGVSALEKYDGDGLISTSSGLHGLASSTGRNINGRFLVICLEDLRQETYLFVVVFAVFLSQILDRCFIILNRPYVGGVVNNDLQKKLALPEPKLPNGKRPSGFIDFAVNMLNLDNSNLFCVTSDGYGLRETLFYHLFSQLQVYATKTAMISALPCITHGALSLDGGMIKKNDAFFLGDRKDAEVRFPVISEGRDLPATSCQTEDKIKLLKWERHSIGQDIGREQRLLEKTKANLKSLGD